MPDGVVYMVVAATQRRSLQASRESIITGEGKGCVPASCPQTHSDVTTGRVNCAVSVYHRPLSAAHDTLHVVAVHSFTVLHVCQVLLGRLALTDPY
ncbi:hypothetical protein E2C01_084921 [Portunus trituberculatus]|uniref:Uncharacterized protein n=1 Tax=Portunus trituberculatus TaxID=210409 RepID=A0A5B7J7H4_PORTR|nr:hypothetical protein [Portunus trituberculatus]